MTQKTWTAGEKLKAADLNDTITSKASTAHTHNVSEIADMSVAGRTLVKAPSPKTALDLKKADVGLGAADNTADIDKPVSTAQAAAIAGVAVLAGTGAPDNSVGAARQFYLDTVTGRLYGPKGATAWPSTYFDLSAPTVVAGVAPVSVDAPIIAGVYQTGSTLTASAGNWTGTPAPAYAYQWMRGPAPSGVVDPNAPTPPFDPSTLTAIFGATNSSYTIVTADLGLRLYVRVASSNTAGSSVAYSLPTGAISAPPSLIPANTSLPLISGAAQSGVLLTGTNGSWTNSPTSYAYQWKANGIAISGATLISYTPLPADISAVLTLTVTASNASGSSTPATSAPTAAVLADALTIPLLLSAPVITGAAQDALPLSSAQASWSETLTAPTNVDIPTVSGTPTVGQLLTATTGNWVANPAPSYAYQWKRTGVAISGATSSTYTLVTADSAETITVTVTATNTVNAGNATSLPTAAVANPASVPVNSTVPTISGTVQQNQTLTASPGAWSNTPTSYTYQWKRAGTNISGATASTYALVLADVGSTITVSVTAINAAGASASAATSAPTATVAAVSADGINFNWTGARISNGGNTANTYPSDGPTMFGIGNGAALAGTDVINDIYFELKINALTGGAVANFGFDQYPNVDNPDSAYYFARGFKWISTTGAVNTKNDRFDNTVGATVAFPTTGQTARVAFKLSTRMLWVATGTGNWNGSPSANPATNTGGIQLPTATNFIPHFVFDSGYADADNITINARASTWIYTAPSGFTANRS